MLDSGTVLSPDTTIDKLEGLQNYQEKREK